MDIQLTSLPQACSGRKLSVKHSRLINSVKSYRKKIKYFNALFGINLMHHIYDPFTLIIIMRTQTSLTDCYIL
jgi:hypothetical protein